jgi:hypothetical protein
MGLTESPFKTAMYLAHQPQMHQGSMVGQALAWFVLGPDDGHEIIYTGGVTF